MQKGQQKQRQFLLLAEGLAELNSDSYNPVEALGICTINAGSDTQIADLARLYRELGKQVFAICDKQSDEKKALIEAEVDALFMHEERGFEDLVIKNTPEAALKRFVGRINWPVHILAKFPDPALQPKEALREYFKRKKAEWGIADFLAQCEEDEIPQWLRDVCTSLKAICYPLPTALDVPEVPKIITIDAETDS